MSTSQLRKISAFVMCIKSGEYEGELLVGKVYRTARPEKDDPRSDLRIIDESREDYLYPAKWFVPVELPAKARKVLVSAS